jgi:hypothetical protein
MLKVGMGHLGDVAGIYRAMTWVGACDVFLWKPFNCFDKEWWGTVG